MAKTGSPSSTPDIGMAALVAIRGDMLRFAKLQVRDDAMAEDLVQDAIEAALRHSSSFEGRSTLKSWVFAILRNRIIDHLRQANRTVSLSSLVEDNEDWQERFESMFNERGGWRDDSKPHAWPSPEESMQTRQFWVVFEACLNHLPANTGRVFMMREFLGFEAREICAQLGISTNNCYVVLHRARQKLRGCMESGWGRPGGNVC